MKDLFGGLFEGKRILVTGHTGFKGAWLSLWLRELGAHVTGYALEPPTSPSMFEACRLDEKIDSVIGDVCDPDRLEKTFKDSMPEVVFHLAAQSLVRVSYKEPVLTYATNVMGTANVLEACRNCPSVRTIVVVTSDKCYENREWEWGYREIDPLGGRDPYSSSKGCAELVTRAYRESFFNPSDYERHRVSLSSVRAGNVIGGGDWGEDRLVPDCIKALSGGGTIRVRNPWSVRPWQYVLEPLNGYLTLAARMLQDGRGFADAWNFGPPEEASVAVREVVDKVIELWGGGQWENLSGASTADPHEAKYLKLDISKARQSLMWVPVLSFDEALDMTVSWYKHHYQTPEDILGFSLEQIKLYSERAVKSGR